MLERLPIVGPTPTKESLWSAVREQVTHEELAISSQRLGGIARECGELSVARAHLEKALAECRVAQASPLPPDEDAAGANKDIQLRTQGLLLTILHELVNTTSQAGDSTASKGYIDEATSIAHQFFAELPSASPGGQMFLQPIMAKLGTLISVNTMSRLDRQSLEELCAGQRRRVADVPTNLEFKRNLANTLASLADKASKKGDTKVEREYLEESLAVSRTLSTSEPENHEWMSEIYLALARLGNHFTRMGDTPRGITCIEESLAIVRKLHNADPDNVKWTANFSRILTGLGEIARQAKDFATACKHTEESLRCILPLSCAVPGDQALQFDLFKTLILMANIQTESRKINDATLALYTAAATQAKAQIGLHPDDDQWKTCYAEACFESGKLLAILRQIEAAENSIHAAHHLCSLMRTKGSPTAGALKILSEIEAKGLTSPEGGEGGSRLIAKFFVNVFLQETPEFQKILEEVKERSDKEASRFLLGCGVLLLIVPILFWQLGVFWGSGAATVLLISNFAMVWVIRRWKDRRKGVRKERG